jgi:hypothetical protein
LHQFTDTVRFNIRLDLETTWGVCLSSSSLIVSLGLQVALF